MFIYQCIKLIYLVVQTFTFRCPILLFFITRGLFFLIELTPLLGVLCFVLKILFPTCLRVKY